VIANQTARSLFEGEEMQAALAIPVFTPWPEEPPTTYRDAEQPAAIGRELIGTVHRHLIGASIAFVFRQAMSTHDKTTLAKASKAGAKLSFFTGHDLCIDVNHEAWLKLTPEQRVALIDHELCHFGVEDTDKGTRFVLLSHDVEEFGSIVNRWGLWKPDLRIFGRIVGDQGDLFALGDNSTVTMKAGGEEVTMTGRQFSDAADRMAAKGL
jgi:hypothetical protein